jgi:hypothetical protein
MLIMTIKLRVTCASNGNKSGLKYISGLQCYGQTKVILSEDAGLGDGRVGNAIGVINNK